MPDKFLPHFFQRTDKMSPDQVYLRKHAGFSPEETGQIQLIHPPAIANEPITQKHKDTHKKSIPVGSKANTGTKGFTAIVNTGENTNSTKV